MDRSRPLQVWSHWLKSILNAAKSGTGTLRSAMTACCQPLATSADRDSQKRPDQHRRTVGDTQATSHLWLRPARRQHAFRF